MFVCAIIHMLQIFESGLFVETKLYKVVVGWILVFACSLSLALMLFLFSLVVLLKPSLKLIKFFLEQRYFLLPLKESEEALRDIRESWSYMRISVPTLTN